MRWSIPLATIGGTAVRLHLTFLMLLAWIGIAAWLNAGPGAAVGSLLFMALLFLCVVLHEFGHIAVARRFGIRTPDVTLLPIGGVSSLERMPDKPWQELLMALAGPAVNLVIAAALVLGLGGMPGIEALGSLDRSQGLIAQLAIANLSLAIFNLLPAFPMDGGRVLRALLATRLGHARGTRIAASIGEGAAILFGFVGLVAGHPLLLFIALFVYIAAAAESGAAMMRDTIAGRTAGDVMITAFVRLSPESPLSTAADALLRTSQREFPLAGAAGWQVLTRETIIAALAQRGEEARLVEVAGGDLACVNTRDPAEAAMRLLEGGAPAVGVVDSAGALIGMVTWENLSEQLLIAQAAAKRRGATDRQNRAAHA